MSEIKYNRDGTAYELVGDFYPPSLSKGDLNRQFYWLKDATVVINNLLDRIYELEKIVENNKK